jgi:hypothetical protein
MQESQVDREIRECLERIDALLNKILEKLNA